MNERSKQMFEQFGHVPGIYDAHTTERGTDDQCYIVHADAKDETAIDFIVFELGYKQAWAEARRQLRVGSELLPVEPEVDDDGNVTNTIKVEPGKFKCRRVFALDRKPRKEAGVVTGRQLLDTATQRGIGFNAKLRDLLEELEGQTASSDDSGDDSENEAA